jgi:PAS domain S-box-containing protein
VDSPRLTPRERDVLSRVIDGKENRVIADELGVSEQSVKEHVSALFDKFRVANRAGLTEAALRLEFTGSLTVDRTWARQFFRESEVQICVLRGPELRYETVNYAFRRAVGERPVIGRTMREAFPELEGQGIFERVERVYATGRPAIVSEGDARWDRGQGLESRKITLVLQPLRDAEGRVNGVISFAVDVTEAVA